MTDGWVSSDSFFFVLETEPPRLFFIGEGGFEVSSFGWAGVSLARRVLLFLQTFVADWDLVGEICTGAVGSRDGIGIQHHAGWVFAESDLVCIITSDA